jgi:hypothetical protein
MESRCDNRAIDDHNGERVDVSTKPPKENHVQNQGFQAHENVSASKMGNGLEPLRAPTLEQRLELPNSDSLNYFTPWFVEGSLCLDASMLHLCRS